MAEMEEADLPLRLVLPILFRLSVVLAIAGTGVFPPDFDLLVRRAGRDCADSQDGGSA